MIALPYFEQVESAKTPADLFSDPDKARSVYRRLAKILHPDVNPGDTRAEGAFARLSELWAQYNGTSVPSAPNNDGRVVYQTKRYSFFVGDLAKSTDFANIYSASYITDSHVRYGALKMPRSPKNNDLIENEVMMLKQLKEQVPAKYQIYHPTVLDTFMHRDKTSGKQRRAVVTTSLSGFVSLREVLEAYPEGIHPRHVAWIARRLWIALDTAHEAGVIHGAVFPENIMVHPTDHGLALINWSYARPKGEKLKAAVPYYKDKGWYGRSIDQPLDHRIDVRQAARTLDALLGEQSARPFRAFFSGCQVASAPTAGELYMEFEELLTRVYGARKYIPFEMPTGWKRVA